MRKTVLGILTLAWCSVVVLLATACGSAAPATSFEAGQPVEAAAATQSTRQVPTPTPDNSIVIDAIVLATELNNDGSPVDELVAIPANTSVAYLVVLVRDIEENTRFETEWLRNGEVIGHTETRVRDVAEGEQWIALRFAPDGGFTTDKYSVRLAANGSPVESLVFNAGGGAAGRRASAATPRLVFTRLWSVEQPSINARTTFESGTNQVVAVLTNARGQPGSLTSYWYYGNEFYTEIESDPVQLASTRTFTLQTAGPLPPGRYSVTVHAGERQVASSSFLIEAPPGAETEATVEALTVVTDMDAASRTPIGDPIEHVEPPIELLGMALIENLSPPDVLDIVWIRNDEVVSTTRVAGETVPRNWITSRYTLPAEDASGEARYRVVVVLNGESVAQREFTAGATEAG